MAEITHLLRTTPMEDLRPRLRPRLSTETPLSGIEKSSFSVGSSDQLSESARLEHQLIQEATWFESVNIKHGHRDRVLARLAKLHAQSLKIFEETPGFGTSRVREMPIRKSFIELPELTRIPLATQPESRAMNNPLWRHLEDWNFVSKFQDSAALSQEQRWHVLSVANFVNSPGYGYIPHIMGQRYDIEHVWGHQPHGFRFAPALNDWCVVRLDLVSLLLHDPPVVYMSENLPMMAELNAAPTRTLNNFELASLKQLLEGAPLIVAPDNDRLRMMGAIRSGDSCLQCHEVENGRMLGAFSYELVRSPASTR